MQSQKTALITGANRGLGLEVARQLLQRQHRVLLGSRDLQQGREAALSLKSPLVEAVALDVSREASIKQCLQELQGRPIDVLVNNAGVYPSGDLLSSDPATIRGAFEVHLFGALLLCQALVPGMLARGFGRVVNVSSGYGSLDEGLQGSAAYSLSKAALNALTLKLASEVRGDLCVNAVCPGWVRTRMGGAAADLSVEEGADSIVWLATLPAGGANGGFFRSRAKIPW